MKLVLIILTGLLATACASTQGFNMTPVETAELSTRYERGFATVTSNQENSSVQVYPAGAMGDGRFVFDIAAINHGEGPVNFGTENVSLLLPGGQTIAMMTREELAAEARRVAANQRTAAVLVGLVAAYAAYEMAESSGGGYISGPYGTTTYGYNYFDAGAAALGIGLAGAGTVIAVDAINTELDGALGQLNGGALATTTVDPAHVYGGRVQAHPIDVTSNIPPSAELHVAFGGETHIFPFSIFQGPANLMPYNSGLVTGDAAYAGAGKPPY